MLWEFSQFFFCLFVCFFFEFFRSTQKISQKPYTNEDAEESCHNYKFHLVAHLTYFACSLNTYKTL